MAKSEIKRYLNQEVAKVMGEVASPRRSSELSKSSKRESKRGRPEKAVPELASEIAKSSDLAFTAGVALAKQAKRSPVNLNPFACERIKPAFLVDFARSRTPAATS